MNQKTLLTVDETNLENNNSKIQLKTHLVYKTNETKHPTTKTIFPQTFVIKD